MFAVMYQLLWDYPGKPIAEKQNQEGKTNLDLLEQEIASGNVIQINEN